MYILWLERLAQQVVVEIGLVLWFQHFTYLYKSISFKSL